MGLVSKHDRPMGQSRVPSLPEGGALNRTEHAALGLRIKDKIRCGKPEPVQFCPDGFVTCGANHDNLFGFQFLPLFEQITENGGGAPGKQQFGPAHARGSASRENDRSERDWVRRRTRSHIEWTFECNAGSSRYKA